MINLLGNLPQAMGAAPPVSMAGAANFPVNAGVQPINEMAGISSAMAQNQQRAQAMPKRTQGGGWRDILGAIGDALLAYNGMGPMYGPMRAQRREQERQEQANAALGAYLGNLDPALVELVTQAGPAAAMQAYGLAHQDNRPAILKEADAYHDLPPDQRASVDSYLKLRFPGAQSPIVLGPNDTFETPGAPTAESGETIAEDESGNRVRYNPETGAWEPVGGPTASPSAGFPQ